jgi:Na+-driven multidrug efflux pump
VITLVSLWVLQVPLAVALSRAWEPATQGVWWAMAAASTANGLMTALWFARGRWKRCRV